MKTIRWMMMAAVLMLAVSCCDKTASKTLVLYYSQTGTTQIVAEELQGRLGADIEEILPTVPYETDFQATIQRGQKEMTEGNWPEIQPLKSKIKNYDVIFLGFPVWFGTYANPIETVLKTVDFSGKTVVPFCTFGSGGLESSTQAIREHLPDATVLDGYGVRAARVEAVPGELDRFLAEKGFLDTEVEPLADFPELHPVTEEEAEIFRAAISTYPMMMGAQASEVAARAVPGGMEYRFKAADAPRGNMPMPAGPGYEVYVLDLEGQDPVFTRAVR